LERGKTCQFQKAVHQAGGLEVHTPEESHRYDGEKDRNEEYPFEELGTGKIPAQEVAEHKAQGILNKRGGEEPGKVVSQRIEKAFLVGKGGKQSPEVVQSDEVEANQLLPGEEAVEERHEEGKQDKDAHNQQSWGNEEDDPKCLATLYLVHGSSLVG
jgi:hypothetical protein